jgi:hypothetical protein
MSLEGQETKGAKASKEEKEARSDMVRSSRFEDTKGNSKLLKVPPRWDRRPGQ